MRRRDFLAMGAGGPILGPRILSGLPQAKTTTGSRPNVIVLLTDDQGYGDLSANGNPALKTPHLDQLKDASVRLTNFHVSPMCTPTRGALMTGRHPLANLAMNVSGGRAILRPDLPTMANYFKDAGYATGIFGKWHLGDSYPYRPEDRGFDETVWFPSSHIGSAPDHWNNDYFGDVYRHNGGERQYEGYCTDIFFAEAMTWMQSCSRAKQPFFAYLPTNAPHGPLFVPEEYSKAYNHLPRELAHFFGMIANIDLNVERLERMLRESGLYDNTIVVFLTDNGGTAGVPFYNAGMRGGKVTLWEGGHRVPCFVRWPGGGLHRGRDVNGLTQVQDLLPTLLDLCDVPPGANATPEGISLASLLREQTKQAPDRMLVAQFSRMNVGRPEWGDAAVLWNRWRMVSQEALYDIVADPKQTMNVINQHRDVAARLTHYYDEWWRNVEPRFDSFLPAHIGSERQPLVMLSPCEWADVSLDQSREVRAGVRKNGLWHLQVEQPGRYEFSLMRWPREAELRLTEAAPAHTGECGSYPPGASLPIASASLAIGGRQLRKGVDSGDREAKFATDLSEGRVTMRSAFLDAQGEEICGAYYVYARLKPQAN